MWRRPNIFLGIKSLQTKLPSPRFQVEVVLVYYNGTVPTTPNAESTTKKSDEGSQSAPSTVEGVPTAPKPTKDSGTQEKHDVFSDSEAKEGSDSIRNRRRAILTRKERIPSELGDAQSRHGRAGFHPNLDRVM
ncbi:hypothetical protein L484_000281 [Morus notabilis]|uniref:Uncharacterized protein n=1 Tax=Morus notabilis TaxID=981085 RepID=W9T2G7_9ROSA|nr:hypothetical protein L484_000281 [Morus notabilis]